MAIATYKSPACDTCIDDTIQPVFGTAIGDSVTKCPINCNVTTEPGIPKPLTPDGTPWVVDYFLQVLGLGDIPAPIDWHLNPVFQRLAWLQNLTMFITSPLTNSVDADTNVATRQGEATIVGYTPEEGDIFLATLELDVQYMFRVTATTPITATGASIHRIEYTAFAPTTDIPALFDDLLHKVADYDRYTFNLSSYLAGKSPFQTTTEASTAAQQSAQVNTLMALWETFYDVDSACYVAKTPNGRVYDPNVADAMQRLTSYEAKRTCTRRLTYLWRREVSTYRATCSNSPYNGSGPFSTLKRYPRLTVNANFGLDHIQHTTIEWVVLNGDGMPESGGESLSTIPGTVLHADGYVVSSLYGTTDPAKTAIDTLVSAIYARTVTQSTIDAAYTSMTTLPVFDQYWILPLILMAYEVKI